MRRRWPIYPLVIKNLWPLDGYGVGYCGVEGMKLSELIALAIVWVVATLFLFVGQIHLFKAPVLPLTMTSKEIAQWLEQILWPMTWALYLGGGLLTLIWLTMASQRRFTKTTEVLKNGLYWWLMAIALFGISLVLFLVLSWFNGDFDLEVLYWFPPFIALDVLFLFWLPTAIASPRLFRNLPPGSGLLRKLYRG